VYQLSQQRCFAIFFTHVGSNRKIQNAGSDQRNDSDTATDWKTETRLLRFGLWLLGVSGMVKVKPSTNFA